MTLPVLCHIASRIKFLVTVFSISPNTYPHITISKIPLGSAMLGKFAKLSAHFMFGSLMLSFFPIVRISFDGSTAKILMSGKREEAAHEAEPVPAPKSKQFEGEKSGIRCFISCKIR